MSGNYQRIGNLVRQSRIVSKLTQEQLAGLIDSSVTYVSQLENGRRNPTIKTLKKIARACNKELFQMLMADHKKDEITVDLLNLLADRTPFEKQKAFNILKEMFRTGP